MSQFSLEKLRAVKHIVTHKDCADGTSSAMILRDAFRGRGVKLTFLQYNTPELRALEAEPGMLFCDFSPARERVQEFVDAGTLVLDHHKFAKDVVLAFGENGVFADETTEPGVCGAVLAYRHVWLPLDEVSSHGAMMEADPLSGEIIRDLATLAGIRDTWQKADPRWQAACEQAEALRFWPLERLLDRDPHGWPGLMQPIGSVIFAKNLQRAQELTETSYRFVSSKGTRVVIFGGTSMSSDVAEAAGDTVDLVVGFSYKTDEGKPILIFSTRSHMDFNCGEFCKAHGGGGHTKAAGFSVPLALNLDPNPFQHFLEILEVYEGNQAKQRLADKLGDVWAAGIAEDEKDRKAL
jgi:oligoribonuclease NrnB/cAMP/cGMP phosphodiesterase (DHH superfamily)